MSLSEDVNKKTQKPICGEMLQSVCNRFNYAVNTLEGDKPDTLDFGLGSPISPLRTNRGSFAAAANNSSCSSSSGSATGRATSGSAKSSTHSEGNAGASGGNGSCVTSPFMNLLPAGNICPSGKIGKTGMMCQKTTRADVLGRGGNYGHGSIIRGSPSHGTRRSGSDTPPTGKMCSVKRAMTSTDLEEVKKIGNEQYKKGQFAEALKLYDRAIAICPENAACRSNRAAAMIAMDRLGEAVKECEEAVRLDPTYTRAHQRLASLYMRLGQVENARKHINFTGELPDPMELQKLQAIERHINRCAYFRKLKDWKCVLRESDSAITSGADSSLVLIALKVEALLRLHQLDEADATLSRMVKLESLSPCSSQTKFAGMLSSSFIDVVKAQVDMVLGRFESAESAAKRAQSLDPQNQEVARILAIVKSVLRARAHGNELFTSGKYSDACLSYGEGLKSDPSNPVLYCNRAACYSKLGQWEKSIEDCSEALIIQPSYTKALLRRAASYAKLERWKESIQDYEALRKELPSDTGIAEALFHAQVALRDSRGEKISNTRSDGEVERVTCMEQFQAAISLPGVSIVHFMVSSNQQCIRIAPFIDALCRSNPSLKFLKVDVNDNPAIAKSENVRIVPTFKIYKNGTRMKEMICPSHQVLEFSVRHYAL